MLKILKECDKPYTAFEEAVIRRIERIIFKVFETIPNRFEIIRFKHANPDDNNCPAYSEAFREDPNNLYGRYFGECHFMTINIDNMIKESDRLSDEYFEICKDVAEKLNEPVSNFDINSVMDDVKHTVVLYTIVHEIMHSLTFTDNDILGCDYTVGDISSYNQYRKTIELLVDMRTAEFIRDNAKNEEFVNASGCKRIVDPVIQMQLNFSRENISTPFCLGAK